MLGLKMNRLCHCGPGGIGSVFQGSSCLHMSFFSVDTVMFFFIIRLYCAWGPMDHRIQFIVFMLLCM